FTAENTSKAIKVRMSSFSFNEAAALHCGKLRFNELMTEIPQASMRPQLFTAENNVVEIGFTAKNKASMRPQLFTAENRRPIATAADPLSASMRPQLFTAENDVYGASESDWVFPLQ